MSLHVCEDFLHGCVCIFAWMLTICGHEYLRQQIDTSVHLGCIPIATFYVVLCQQGERIAPWAEDFAAPILHSHHIRGHEKVLETNDHHQAIPSRAL